jgi:hypothetical protein
MQDRAAELLLVDYFHVVFTLPEVFNALALSNKRALYNLLFDAVAQTLQSVAAGPKHLGARIGFLAILHTWGQNLSLHPHVHCVVPGGGLAHDGKRWIPCRPGFFLPVRVLSRVFRGKFIDLVRSSWNKGVLRGLPDNAAFERLIESSVRNDWVVYCKPPFGGPEQVLKYLSRYTHRIAISNSRLLAMDETTVTFRWKDYAHGNRTGTLTLRADEFLRRFLLHTVPSGFVRIRHFGFMANRNRRLNIEQCRLLLNMTSFDVLSPTPGPGSVSVSTLMTFKDPSRCPDCGVGHMLRGANIPPHQTAPTIPYRDSS